MSAQNDVTVFDFGGSIVAPDGPDTKFLGQFIPFLQEWLDANENRKAIMVVGGGGAARAYQGAVRELAPQTAPESLDWVGVMATRLNAELMRALLGPLCPDPVVTNPSAPFEFTGRVLMAAGWKPGFSTDYDAVVLAERFGADKILMLSNIAKVYDSDPRTNPEAKPLDHLTWEEYKSMAGEEWKPGANVPFDPVATARAAQAKLTVVAAAGQNLENLQSILDGKDFVGTIIAP
ncbi:MAG: UMP kinase [Spirochaetales bacterium]|nr:UMP kinase [Spirochaetales bacterium]